MPGVYDLQFIYTVKNVRILAILSLLIFWLNTIEQSNNMRSCYQHRNKTINFGVALPAYAYIFI